MRSRHRPFFVPVIAVVGLIATGCDDGTTTQSGTASSTSTIQNQAQDRDRLQQAVDKVVSACQDRDRLRDLVQDQLRDRVRDIDMLGVCDGSVLQATIDDYTVAGETVTVQVRLSTQAQNAEATELRGDAPRQSDRSRTVRAASIRAMPRGTGSGERRGADPIEPLVDHGVPAVALRAT